MKPTGCLSKHLGIAHGWALNEQKVPSSKVDQFWVVSNSTPYHSKVNWSWLVEDVFTDIAAVEEEYK